MMLSAKAEGKEKSVALLHRMIEISYELTDRYRYIHTDSRYGYISYRIYVHRYVKFEKGSTLAQSGDGSMQLNGLTHTRVQAQASSSPQSSFSPSPSFFKRPAFHSIFKL